MVIVTVGGTGLFRALVHPSRWLTEVRQVRPLVSPATVVFADTLTLRAFEFLESYPERTAWVDFKDVDSMQQIPAGSLVVINRRSIAWLDAHGGIWGSGRAGYRQHSFYGSPPQTWIPVHDTPTLSAFRVTEQSDRTTAKLEPR
jgi:hypothetical protein